MGEHTPGPWKANISDTGAFSIEAEGGVGGFGMTLCQRSDWEHRADESAANGRLIAASPELLAALKLLLEEVELSGNAEAKDYGWLAALRRTRAAIAKATGTPS